MQRESNWRYYFILIVFVLCLIFIYPTARYVTFLFTNPTPEGEDATVVAAYDEEKGRLQRQAIKLGLDLIGGVDVLLGVDRQSMREKKLGDMREEMAKILRDNRISASLKLNKAGTGLTLAVEDKADARQAANLLSDYVDPNRGRFDRFEKDRFLQEGEGTLYLAERYFNQEVKDSIETAEKVIRERVDEFGVTQPSVSLQSGTEGLSGIRVQVPGEKDPDYVISQIIRPAQLEFYLVHEESEQLAAELYEEKEVEYVRGETRKEFVLKEGKSLPTGYIGMVGETTDRSTTPPSTRRQMYIVKYPPEMTGKHLRDAYVQTNAADLNNPIKVGLTFDSIGAGEFRRVTREQLEKRLAIALDKKIYSAPVIRSVIPNGQAVIEGNFDSQEARDLALVLKAGALPADLKAEEKRAVGPTLGFESITQSVRALAMAGALITAFMVVYYGMAGFIAIIALLLNILVIVACLDLFNATLTLSGIGGMILTLGMAVDANVLIYERIREELEGGRDLRAAIRSGFGRAFSVIFDSNLTTLLAAFVLLQFGEGSVQGFALTMAFGLLANLFTGLTVTYALCSLWFNMRGKLSLGALHLLRKPRVNFIGIRYGSFSLSAILVAGGLIFLVANKGPNFAVDFQGGVMSEVRIQNTEEDMSESLKKALPTDQAKVQRVKTAEENDYLVRMALQQNPDKPHLDGDPNYTQSVIEKSLTDAFGDKVIIMGTTSVSKEVGQEFQWIAITVVLSASFCILLYLWFRFELVFGVAAVIALLHDLIITLSLITIFGVQISLDIVSALLILLGFSVNDTIVIFDRVRENSRSMFGHSFKDICNSAMNRTLSRTLITSGTTLLVMLIMYFWGGHSLAPFALTLIIGSLVGTYSSDFVATPLVYWWNERQQGKLVEQLGRKASNEVDGSASSAAASEALPAGSAGASSSGGGPRRGRR